MIMITWNSNNWRSWYDYNNGLTQLKDDDDDDYIDIDSTEFDNDDDDDDNDTDFNQLDLTVMMTHH